MASFTEIDRTQIAEPARAICNEKDDKVVSQETENQELEHVNRMKQKYGETDWMWYVEDTEDDCRIAEMHRQWQFNRGVSPDFNIHEVQQSINCRCQHCKEDLLREIEAAKAWENSEEKKMEDEKNRRRHQETYTDEYTGITYKIRPLYPTDFYDYDEEYEPAICGYDSDK